jgi:hypothetical protein
MEINENLDEILYEEKFGRSKYQIRTSRVISAAEFLKKLVGKEVSFYLVDNTFKKGVVKKVIIAGKDSRVIVEKKEEGKYRGILDKIIKHPLEINPYKRGKITSPSEDLIFLKNCKAYFYISKDKYGEIQNWYHLLMFSKWYGS